MKNDTDTPNALRRVFGGAFMLAGAATLMMSPSMLGGWVMMLTGEKTSNGQVQPSMGDWTQREIILLQQAHRQWSFIKYQQITALIGLTATTT